MRRTISARGCAAALLVVSFSVAPDPAFSEAGSAPIVEAKPHGDIFDVIERGRLAFLADDFVVAGAALDEVLGMPEFSGLVEDAQYRVLLLAAYSASGRKDFLSAHEYAVLATGFPQADSWDWLLRAQHAARVEAWPDAAIALTAIATRWPQELGPANAELLRNTVAGMNKDGKHARERLALIDALYEADYKLRWGMEPSAMWADLVADALARNDTVRARRIVKRIRQTHTLIEMRINKDFAALVKLEPKAFDIRMAAERHCEALRRASVANPRSLGVLVQYGYALMNVGEFEKLVRLTDEVIQRIDNAPPDEPPYDDIDDQINWIHDHKYRALRFQGRWDEALVAMQAYASSRTETSDKVSQAINLAFYLNDLGKPDRALAALDGIDWVRSLSPYGRMALQLARYQACLQLGDVAEAERILAYLRTNKDESPGAWQAALLDSGDMDTAAAVLIARLRDPKDRGEALLSAQDYLDVPLLPRESAERAAFRALLARADVSAAIAAAGRRERIPVYSPRY